MRRLALLSMLLVLIVPAAGCAGDTPEKAARAWVQAIADLDGNRIAELTCEAQKPQMQNLMWFYAGFLGLGRTLGVPQPTPDLSGLEFTVEARPDHDLAVVRVSGRVRTSALGFWTETPLDMALLVVKESGKWKVCGEAPGY